MDTLFPLVILKSPPAEYPDIEIGWLWQFFGLPGKQVVGVLVEDMVVDIETGVVVEDAVVDIEVGVVVDLVVVLERRELFFVGVYKLRHN